MEQKKSKKVLIVIIILVIIIVLTIVGIAFTYFATDIFKSNRELFLKYASTLTDERTAFLDSSLGQYYQKLNTTSYENEGELNFQINMPDAQEITEIVEDFNISFSGKVDSKNTKVQQDISINYNDDIKFPVSYRQMQNIVGLQTDYVGSKYIAIKNDNLDQLIEELGITFSIANISQDIDSSKISGGSIFTKEEIISMQEKYLEVIIQQLKESNFTKIKTSLGEGYSLTLSSTEVRNIIIRLLEVLKSDTNLLDKINEYLKNKIDSTTISKIQENISNIEEDNEKLEITLYQRNKEVNKIIIKINEGKLEIEKVKDSNELQYLITIQDNEEANKIYLNAKYTGIQTENIKENFELGFSISNKDNQILTEKKELTNKEEKENIQLLIADIKSTKLLDGQDTTTFTDKDIEKALNSGDNENYINMKLEKLTETSFKITYISNNRSYEFDNTGKIIKEPEAEYAEGVNENNKESQVIKYKYNYENNIKITGNVEIEEMTDDNTLILNDLEPQVANNLINAIGERIQLVNQEQMGKLGLSEAQNPILYIIPITNFLGNNGGMISNSDLTQLEVKTFNAKFEIYESTNTKGATVKGLLTVIQTSNEESSKKIEEINFDGQEYEVTEQNITLIKSNIGVEDPYKVEFEYNRETGEIYRVVINKK